MFSRLFGEKRPTIGQGQGGPKPPREQAETLVALEKLQAGASRIPMQVSPAVAPVAQVNPLSAFKGGVMSLFSTHPPTEERVRRLLSMARDGVE